MDTLRSRKKAQNHKKTEIIYKATAAVHYSSNLTIT